MALGAVFGGGDWPQPEIPRNNSPDNAAPAFSDFHMATPLLVFYDRCLLIVDIPAFNSIRIRSAALERTLVGVARVDAFQKAEQMGPPGIQARARCRRLQGKAHLYVRRRELFAGEPGVGRELRIHVIQVPL